jgi:DeoR/GlpR family transcriptional regulator of sugar metabolism
MIRKAGFILIALAVVAGIYYYTRKKKTGIVYDPNSATSVADTSAALNISKEAAQIVDERRNMIANSSTTNSEIKGVQDIAETLVYNGKSYPILGYAREESRGQTVVMIPIEFTTDFTSFSGGTLSRALNAKATVNRGKYAGTWTAWYIYTKDTWPRSNVYIDAPWKD